jgi:hypothetical protein
VPPAVNSPAARAAYADLFISACQEVTSWNRQQGDHALLLLDGLWAQASNCGLLADGVFTSGVEFWYSYAVSQLHIRAAASNNEVAQLLCGSTTLEEEWLR